MRHAALIPGLLLLALSFSAAWAGGPKKGGGTPATPPPAAPVDPVAALTEEDINKALEPYFQAAMKGDRDAALDALIVILDDPAKSVYHGVAYARLADSVRDLEQPYAALIAAGEAIRLDPTRGASQVKPSLKIAGEVHDLAYLEGVFAKNVGLDVDAATRAELAWLAARGAYADGQLSTALGILALVNKDNPYYAKGQALKGVILNRQGKYSEAMAALLIAESLSAGDPELQDVVRLNLARTYYAAENYTRSIEYYAMVSRASPAWPEAQFERAWAHFRFNDTNGALGLLQNHVSPFYSEWYFPEAQLLRTYSLFLMCKFPEASKQIDEFQATWKPVRETLRATLGAMDEAAAFADARAYVNDEPTKLPGMVLRPYGADERLAEAIKAVELADRELEKLNQRGTSWAKHLAPLVKARRDELVKTEGARVMASVQAKIDELGQMISDTEISRLDMLNLEKRLYEQAAASGEMAETRKMAQREVKIRKGYVSWPYEGEYWADEVGYYRVNAVAECPQGLTVGGGQ